MFIGIIPYAHKLLEEIVNDGDVAVDATCGNGNDTLFLSKLVGKAGSVYAFDIQQQAIDTTSALLEANNLHNVHLIHDSHEKVDEHIPQAFKGKLAGAIFNLGYLPRSDKKIITKSDSTLHALESLLSYVRIGGRIVLVVYHGHEGGKEEKDAVISYCLQLDQKHYSVISYQFINQKNNPPFVIAIEKLTDE